MLFYLLVVLVAINMVIIYLLPDLILLQNIVMVISIGFYLVVAQFFRVPNRAIPVNPTHILAPADGKVVVVERTMESEYFNEERIQISIFMSPLNVHNNRVPVSGVVESFKYHPGNYHVAWHPKSSTENERTTMVLSMADDVKILVRQIAGALARRIKWYVNEGDNVAQGQEFGFIKFGSRLDVFLPIDSKILVETGTKTKGGVTVLAELVSS
ncbi:MAG: phosphatidylserine decarboxylase family protein [Bacteroidota bacterium]